MNQEKKLGLKHAQIVLHKYPVADSAIYEVAVDQIISGNLNELMPEGIAPFNYKIVSASNGKIVCSRMVHIPLSLDLI